MGRSHGLKQGWQRGWQWWQSLRWYWRGLLITLVLLGVVRSLPYLAPIRAVDLVQDDQAVEFVDRNGLPLGTILTRDQEHTVAVPLAQISTHFRHAILAAEDQRFYQHGALDERAIVRALLEAVQARQIVSGASTITMQLARMIDPVPFGFAGKLREVWTAWRLFAGMSRDEILQAYINRLPMGSNIYGVEAAARIYFGIPASDLTIGQASLLAGIPNDPNNLQPRDRLIPLKRRQTYVLDRMVANGYITRTEGDRAYTEEIDLQPREQGIIAAPHLQFWLAQQLPADHPPQIRTTVDRPLQQFVETQVMQVVQGLASHQVHHAAAIVIDNATGQVLAYVGSPDYFADAQMGRNDGVQALRQPGSTLKPFAYELGLETRQIQPNTVLADIPTRYAIPGARLYNPSDYSETFQGPVRVRYALANSLNVPAVRVLEQVGVGNFRDRLQHLGFTHLTQPPDYYGLGLVLGSGEVRLWELAQAYTTLARQGDAIALRAVNPDVRLNDDAPTLRDLQLSETLLITDMLADAHARARAFGVDSLLSLPFPAAVKTGTSSDYRDTWTVGFTRDYTVAVWAGNFDSAPMQQVSGVTGAAPLWNRIMLHLHEQQEPAAFPTPPGMVKRPICAISGAKPVPACPAVVQEYIRTEELAAYDTQADPFFPVDAKTGVAQLHWPAEYNEWLAMQPDRAIAATPTTPGSLRIVSPRNGDYFVIGAVDSQARSPQKLQFKLATSPKQPVQWRLNGQPLPDQATASVFWSPQPGHWTLQASSGRQTDTVQFEVQLAENRPTRRGFSFGNSLSSRP